MTANNVLVPIPNSRYPLCSGGRTDLSGSLTDLHGGLTKPGGGLTGLGGSETGWRGGRTVKLCIEQSSLTSRTSFASI
jgi:hypothetical protein